MNHSDIVTGEKFYVDHKITWGPGRRTVMLAFANGAALSDPEVASLFGMNPKTVSARRTELWRHGYVAPVGVRKATRQLSQVWAATETGNKLIRKLSRS